MSEVKSECSTFGTIERGEIIEKSDDLYTVRSLDRNGIVIHSISSINSTSYNILDVVVFCSFPDGTGKIIGNI